MLPTGGRVGLTSMGPPAPGSPGGLYLATPQLPSRQISSGNKTPRSRLINASMIKDVGIPAQLKGHSRRNKGETLMEQFKKASGLKPSF